MQRMSLFYALGPREKIFKDAKASTFLKKIGTQWVHESKLHVFCKLCTFLQYSQVAVSGLETDG